MQWRPAAKRPSRQSNALPQSFCSERTAGIGELVTEGASQRCTGTLSETFLEPFSECHFLSELQALLPLIVLPLETPTHEMI